MSWPTYGISAIDALGAASWRARAWLGLDGVLTEGTTADFVVYDRNPLDDLSVLAEPKRIVLRGVVVALTRRPEVVDRLRAAGCVFAEEEAALVLAEAEDAERLEAMLVRRVSGEPLEQVLGWAEFCGLRIRVTPGVFVPRRRTAFLVHLALHDPESRLASTRSPVVVDLCCGTGALGLAIAAGLDGDIELHAADLDPDAVACARLNVTSRRGPRGGPVRRAPGYLLGRVDLLAVNAPYVPTDQIAADAARGAGARAPDRAGRGSGRARPAPAGRRRCAAVARAGRGAAPRDQPTPGRGDQGRLPPGGVAGADLRRRGGGTTVVRAISVGAGSSGRMTR